MTTHYVKYGKYTIPLAICEERKIYSSVIIKMQLCLKILIIDMLRISINLLTLDIRNFQGHGDKGHKPCLLMHMINYIFVFFKYTSIYIK